MTSCFPSILVPGYNVPVRKQEEFKEEELIHELLSIDGSAEVGENFTSSAIGRTGPRTPGSGRRYKPRGRATAQPAVTGRIRNQKMRSFNRISMPGLRITNQGPLGAGVPHPDYATEILTGEARISA